MPVASAQQAEHTKRRVARYLKSLLDERAASLSSVGKLLDVSASRVSAWMMGSRVISVDKAFELGDELRKSGWRTSGTEFLWAAAYWADVLNVVKYLALDPDFGTDAAVMLYSWLPQRLIQFEINEITARLRDKFDIAVPEEIFDTTEINDARRIALELAESPAMRDLIMSDPGAAEAGRYFEQSPFQSTAAHAELDNLCSSNAFQERVLRAWSRYNNAELEGTPSLKVAALAPNPFAALELHVINAVIYASRRLNEHVFPSYVIPKIWRLSAAWLYEVGESEPSVDFPALPRNFLTTSEAEATRSIIDEMNG